MSFNDRLWFAQHIGEEQLDAGNMAALGVEQQDFQNLLQILLRDVFEARAEGANYNRLARAHGYVNGYMRALLESGQATKAELLALVYRLKNRNQRGIRA